jgi:hypothetical protein
VPVRFIPKKNTARSGFITAKKAVCVLAVMMKKSQDDHGCNPYHHEYASQHERRPKQHSLEWVELKSANCHIAAHFRIRAQLPGYGDHDHRKS